MKKIKLWDIYELAVRGSAEGNPFKEVEFGAVFSRGCKEISVDGFYDGNGCYKVRFMPDIKGNWKVATTGSINGLAGIKDEFLCTPADDKSHGPVGVSNAYHFTHRDGVPYLPFGTTCYAWNHQNTELEAKTLKTLQVSPFNKIRMCVFPKHYTFIKNEPEYYPFPGTPEGGWNFERFNPDFFSHLEGCIAKLKDLGIEADIILFHPYDRWGFAKMPSYTDDLYLKYVVARLAAYSNVWWSFANEFDFMEDKTTADWDRFFNIVWEKDPYSHLRSIHNGIRFYDHGKPWVTHASIQHHDLSVVSKWRDTYKKPVVVDECCYEGNVADNWGNATAQAMVDRFWTGFCRSGYVGHGETYMHPDDVLWWSKGGELHGESPRRIAFLRNIMEDGNTIGWQPKKIEGLPGTVTNGKDIILTYLGNCQPIKARYYLDDGFDYKADIIDTWDMTITSLDGVFRDCFTIDLPGNPYIAIRLTRAGRK